MIEKQPAQPVKPDLRKKNGGPRPGSGRKPGATAKVTAKDLLAALEKVSGGQPYTEQLAEDYWSARFGEDKKLAQQYHNLISTRVFSQQLDVTIDETTTVASRQAAFLKALETIGTVVQNTSNQQED
jgi:hypothetical protein